MGGAKHQKIKGAVIYRLESVDGSPNAVSLLKYDYAHSKEGGSHNKSSFLKLDFVTGIANAIENQPPEGLSEKGKIGGFKVVEGDHSHAVYGADLDGICYAILIGQNYPSRIAIAGLEELYQTFTSTVTNALLLAAKKDDLKEHKYLLKEFCTKYKTPEVDKTRAILKQVEGVKGQMQDNITGMLKNSEDAGALKGKADTLNAEAGLYKKRAKQIHKHMWWKDCKSTCMLIMVVVLVLSLFLLPFLLQLPFIAKLLGGGGGGAAPAPAAPAASSAAGR